MKRSADSPVDGNTKLKQMKLFEKKDGGTKIKAVWKHHGEAVKGLKPLMYMMPQDIPGSSKVAAFDMDGTLIRTKSGAKFPKNSSDWTFLSSKVPSKLKSLHQDGYKVLLITNQAGIEKKKTKESEIHNKIQDIMQMLGFPIQALMSTGFNHYRKPSTLMWDFFVKEMNDKVEVDLNSSFYVGDAAGRPKDWQKGKPKDHSCDDRKFAANTGLKFYTPEEFFDVAKPFNRFDWGSVNPKTLLGNETKPHGDFHSKETEIVLLVGYPASGKSSFAKKHLESKGYVVVNRDTLKTPAKCEQVANESLKAKKSVVVDNTNPGKEARAIYIKMAKTHGVPIRCFYFDVPIETAKHMNFYRQSKTRGKIRRIPDVGYNVFKSKFVIPDKTEGFSEVRKFGFVPDFDSEADKTLFLKWT